MSCCQDIRKRQDSSIPLDLEPGEDRPLLKEPVSEKLFIHSERLRVMETFVGMQ